MIKSIELEQGHTYVFEDLKCSNFENINFCLYRLNKNQDQKWDKADKGLLKSGRQDAVTRMSWWGEDDGGAKWERLKMGRGLGGLGGWRGTKDTNGSAREQGCCCTVLPLLALGLAGSEHLSRPGGSLSLSRISDTSYLCCHSSFYPNINFSFRSHWTNTIVSIQLKAAHAT